MNFVSLRDPFLTNVVKVEQALIHQISYYAKNKSINGSFTDF